MDRGNTKQEILKASLELFSVQGFEATSISQIADAVGNRFGLDHIALAIVKGTGNTTGALASTVSHDSHNLTIVYDTPEDALLCANTLKECRGGLVTVKDGKVLALLPLPIAGLLSKLDAEGTAALARKMKEADREVGLTELENPLLRIATLALPVAPEIKMSDIGIVKREVF